MKNIKKLIFINIIIIISIIIYIIITKEKISDNIWAILALVISLINLIFIYINKSKHTKS